MNTERMNRAALATTIMLFALTAQTGALAADKPSDVDDTRPPSVLEPASTPLTADIPTLVGAMKAGGMLVRLESFLELRDGNIRAQVSFQNPSPDAEATLTLKPRTSDARSIARLVNRDGAQYRLVEVSQVGDAQMSSDWTSVPPGGSAFLTATFAPDGAERGVQPFSLSLPVRTAWRRDDKEIKGDSLVEVNFRGLRRKTPATVQRSVERVEAVAKEPNTLVQQASLPVPVPKPASATALTTAGFQDDLAPMVANLEAARPDARRYLFAVGVNAYDDAPDVPFADRSAQLMADLLRKRYGVPEDNVTLITGEEATGLKMLGRLNSLLQRLTPGDTVYFYYAGHGLAGRDGKAVYIVPKDAVPGAYEVEMLSLESLIQRFENSAATRVVAFIDTCFSGRVSREQSLFPGVGPLVPSPVRAATVERTSKVALFLAGQAHQFANAYPERGHRLFSYYLMRGLLDDSADTQDLNAYVAREVRRVSSKRGAEYVQEPRFEGAARVFSDS
jgi:hypothetical protein